MHLAAHSQWPVAYLAQKKNPPSFNKKTISLNADCIADDAKRYPNTKASISGKSKDGIKISDYGIKRDEQQNIFGH